MTWHKVQGWTRAHWFDEVPGRALCLDSRRIEGTTAQAPVDPLGADKCFSCERALKDPFRRPGTVRGPKSTTKAARRDERRRSLDVAREIAARDSRYQRGDQEWRRRGGRRPG